MFVTGIPSTGDENCKTLKSPHSQTARMLSVLNGCSRPRMANGSQPSLESLKSQPNKNSCKKIYSKPILKIK